jgi:hypothetical protein
LEASGKIRFPSFRSMAKFSALMPTFGSLSEASSENRTSGPDFGRFNGESCNCALRTGPEFGFRNLRLSVNPEFAHSASGPIRKTSERWHRYWKSATHLCMSLRTPSVAALLEIRNRLHEHGITFALGGSGLLASLGLVDVVRDWDFTTDSPWEVVKPAMEGLQYILIPPNRIFATEYLCQITLDGAVIEVMGRFAIHKASGEKHAVRTLINHNWNGVPVGCPQEWARAYELIGRPEKARLLRDYLLCISQAPSQSEAGGAFLNSSQRSM